MKFNNIKSYLAVALGLSLTVTSCLKDKDYDNGNIQSVHGGNVQVIGTGLSVSKAVQFLSIALNNSNNDTTFNLIPVTLGSGAFAPQDIHVTLVASDSLLTAYNDSNNTSLSAPTQFTIMNPGGVVTIPKGSNTGYLQVKITPSNFIGHTYAFAYLISGIAEKGYVVSGNFNYGIVAINIKNKYDGVYQLRGFFNRTSPDYSAPYNEKVSMVTTGANSVEMYWKGGPAHPIAGGTASFSNFTTEYFFDLTTNAIISVDNGVTPGSPPFTNGPATTNRYDPVTKTIYAQCYYNNNLARTFTDTLTYIGPRP